MKNIHIGEVKLPIDEFAISRNAILGITNSGKTVTAKMIAEQLIGAGVPLVVFDPIGSWRHLKTAGRGPGLEVVVAGGEYPDLPLTVHSAPEIVRAAIKGNIPLVIDLYDMKLSKADWRRIVKDCFRVLLYENQGVRHIFLEEASEFIPQKVLDGDVYAEVEKLARMGGNRSLGITLINQRAQEVNKAVLELCDNIVLLRQRGTNAIDSLERQMDRLGPDAVKIAKSLPSLQSGECWVITSRHDTAVHTRASMCQTYHPDRRAPKAADQLESVDATEFVEKMKGQLEKVMAEAKENDVAELKKRIASLEREAKSENPAKVKEIRAFTKEDIDLIAGLQKAVDDFSESINKARAILECAAIDKDQFKSDVWKLMQTAGKISAPRQPAASVLLHRRPNELRMPAPRRLPRTVPENSSNGELGRCERMILATLAGCVQGSSDELAVRAVYAPTSGGWNNALGKLRSLGYITRTSPIRLTDDGSKAVCENALSVDEMREAWLSKLGKCERSIFNALWDCVPKGLTSQELAELTNYAATSGGWNNALGHLRSLNLITRTNPICLNEAFLG